MLEDAFSITEDRGLVTGGNAASHAALAAAAGHHAHRQEGIT
jgi:hypothetical protein